MEPSSFRNFADLLPLLEAWGGDSSAAPLPQSLLQFLGLVENLLYISSAALSRDHSCVLCADTHKIVRQHCAAAAVRAEKLFTILNEVFCPSCGKTKSTAAASNADAQIDLLITRLAAMRSGA
ncbi:hypothetical protein DXG01_006416 [Tephrocybe rancida]|nr:hypothetical protein DXG01_006416 [Tephrocybe rancida]